MPFSYVLGITFLGPLISGETITASWLNSVGGTVTADETAVPLRISGGEITIGTDAITQATNAYDAFLADFSVNFNFTGNSGTDTFYISSLNTTNPMSGFTTSPNVLFNYTGTPFVLTVSDDIRARSPYLEIATGTTATTFTTTVFNLKGFEGELNDFAIKPLSYSKTKDKIVNSQNNIWINLSNMAKEKLEGSIDNFITNNYTTALDLAPKESKWFTVESSNKYLNTTITSGITGYFVVDGYIEPLESQGLPNLLLTGNKRYTNRNTIDRLFFKTQNLTGASYITSSNATPVNISYSTATTINTKYVQSIKVDKTNSVNDWIRYSFSYLSAATETVTFNLFDECLYQPYQIVFKNKYGMLESLSMNKKAILNMDIIGSKFNRSIINYEGNFNINRHTTKEFNITGEEIWTLNTDYLPEYMNSVFKEAMLSEEIWLISLDGTIQPVIKLDSNIIFKTQLNDKLCQYTIKVKLSHQTVKNIL